MNRSTLGLPVHHQLLEFTQTHVIKVSDAIPLVLCVSFSSCPQSLLASGSFPMSQLFTWGGQSTRVSASAPQFKSINSLALSFLHPTLHPYMTTGKTIVFFFFFYCSGFCRTLKWNSHGFTCVPHPDSPSHLPLHPIPLGLPSAPGASACLMHPTWAGDLFHPR